jgi:hypothetical protein
MDMDQLKAFAQALHSSPELQAKLHNAYAMAARSVAAEAGFSINELTDTELAVQLHQEVVLLNIRVLFKVAVTATCRSHCQGLVHSIFRMSHDGMMRAPFRLACNNQEG